MQRRLLIIGLLVLAEIIWLVGAAVSATDAPDYEAYVAEQGQTITAIASEYGISAVYLAQYNRVGVNEPLPGGRVIIVPSNSPQHVEPPKTPSVPTTPSKATATTPSGDVIEGRLGTVVALVTQIFSKPGPSKPLFAKTVRGTEVLVTGEVGDYYAVLMADGSTGFIPRKAVGLTNSRMTVSRPAPQPAQKTRSPLLNTAMEYLGVPYVYGGHLPDGIDCSLFVQTVFARHGMKLPRTAAQQSNVGAPIDVTQLQPGDRLYFYAKTGVIGHTGIYLGNGQFIHASSNRGAVAIDSLSDMTYWKKYAGARR